MITTSHESLSSWCRVAPGYVIMQVKLRVVSWPSVAEGPPMIHAWSGSPVAVQMAMAAAQQRYERQAPAS